MTPRWAWLCVSAMLFADCASGTRGPLGNHCDTTADCAGGATCDTAQHLCVAPGAATEVIFVASPAGGRTTASAATTTTDPVNASSANDMSIRLRAPRTVYGRVDVQAATAGSMGETTPVAATIRFHRQGATPAEATVEVQASGTLQQTTDHISFGFNAQLVPGTYDVSITPGDLSQTPPYFASGQIIEAVSDNAPLSLTFVYVRPDPSLGMVSGRVLDAVTQIPMRDVPIQLVDAALGNRVVSTLQATSNGTNGRSVGEYNLWLAPGATANWSLQMVTQPGMTTAGVTNGRLVYQVTRAALGALQSYSGLTVRAASAVSLQGIATGTCEACVDVEASVEGTDLTGMRQAIAGATLNLRSDNVLGGLAAGHSAWFEAQMTTSVDGSFHARLMPGTYQGVITPPRDTPFAVTAVRIEVAGVQRGQVLEVNQLVPVIGTIASDANGLQPVPHALVEAVPLVDPEAPVNPAGAVTLLARRWQVYTGTDGAFRLPLDEGNYLLVVRPVDGSGLPTQLFAGTSVVFSSVNGATDPRPTPIPIPGGQITLSTPFQVRGTVIDSPLVPSAAAPQVGATVRAFARVRRPGTPALDIEIGRASAGASGAYSLLLPSIPLID